MFPNPEPCKVRRQVLEELFDPVEIGGHSIRGLKLLVTGAQVNGGLYADKIPSSGKDGFGGGEELSRHKCQLIHMVQEWVRFLQI
jgi:hypothetical protein